MLPAQNKQKVTTNYVIRQQNTRVTISTRNDHTN